MKKAKYFAIQELVPPAVYEARGEKAWELIDDRMIATIDQLRAKFGSMIINTWYSSSLIDAYGLRQWSGLRTVEYYGSVEAFEASFSQHKYGRAFDALFQNYTAEQVREYVLANPSEFPYLTSMELGVDWFHGDCRNCNRIKTYYP